MNDITDLYEHIEGERGGRDRGRERERGRERGGEWRVEKEQISTCNYQKKLSVSLFCSVKYHFCSITIRN